MIRPVKKYDVVRRVREGREEWVESRVLDGNITDGVYGSRGSR